MTETDKKKILDYWESGLPLTQIRRMMAVSAVEFRAAVKEMKGQGQFPIRKTTIDKVADAYSRGERNAVEICQNYGISYGALRVYKSRLGIKTGRPPRNYKHSERTLAIIDDINEGKMSIAEIARKNGVSWTYAKKVKTKFCGGV